MKKLILMSLLVINQAQAAEADNFTGMNQELPDILGTVNKEANVSLSQAVQKTNAEGGCDRERLVENLQYYFANHTSGKLVIDILHEKKFMKRSISIDESIYSGWTLFEGAILNLSKDSDLALSPTIRMGNTVIGVDKLEHMFGMGSRYYQDYHIKGRSLSATLREGIFKEKTILGGNILATGVFSYADLSANFNGMRFWNHMLGEQKDVIGQDIGPYILCVDDKYEVNSRSSIDFSNYIDASMDESINCSKYATKKSVKRIKKAMKTMAKSLDQDVSCPMSWSKFDEMQAKYNFVIEDDKKGRTISDFILNEEGPGKVSYFNEF